MTAPEYIKWLVGYYGQVRPGQRKDLATYLRTCAPGYLDQLKDVVMRRFSSQYGKVPDIAVFEKCQHEAYAAVRELASIRIIRMLEEPLEQDDEYLKVDWVQLFQTIAARSKPEVMN
ncbi:MAG: hypothetical protein NT080_00395 [Spirochaetes bacterium]|nr:hypothetical protein [Spirochaetota bacterium]